MYMMAVKRKYFQPKLLGTLPNFLYIILNKKRMDITMTQEAMDNYLHMTLKEAYVVLTSTEDPWPNSFQPTRKIKFIDQLISYFQEREEYERCAELLKIKNQVTNELDNRK